MTQEMPDSAKFDVCHPVVVGCDFVDARCVCGSRSALVCLQGTGVDLLFRKPAWAIIPVGRLLLAFRSCRTEFIFIICFCGGVDDILPVDEC